MWNNSPAMGIKAAVGEGKCFQKLRSNFYLFVFGGVAGGIPRRGGSGKAGGFGVWGRLPPSLYVLKILSSFIGMSW
jgi:hypothetical protein